MQRVIVVGQTYLAPDHCVYRVTGIAKNVDTKEQMVVYEEHFGEHRLFCTNYSHFAEEIADPRTSDLRFIYRMNECTVNHDGTITVDPSCIIK